ncbi:MAG: pilus assembly protein PilM [Gammaproteobacteria bacterium]|nr:pilus assembly protein PilM [Gammaproteobacteria bacterium]MDH5694665.1 pilus assembly protein PilM [Gammaproteobacteria bacterium]
MLQLFQKKQVDTSLCAISEDERGVSMVCVDTVLSGDRPVVLNWSRVERQNDEEAVLGKVVRKMQLEDRRCSYLLPLNKYQVVITSKPEVPENELEMAICWQAKDLIDIPIEEAVVDLFTFPDAENIPGEIRHSVYVVAAQRESVSQVAEELFANGIELEAIDIVEMAQRNLASLLADQQEGVALLSINPGNCVITLSKEGDLYVTRKIEVNESSLKRVGLADAELERISLEVQRSLDYYATNLKQTQLKNLYVVPTPQLNQSIVDYLDENLSVKVAVMDLNELIIWGAVPEKKMWGYLSFCLGAALRDWVGT